MDCNESFRDVVSNCGDELRLNCLVAPNTLFNVELAKFNYVAAAQVTSDSNGRVTIPLSALPDGYLSPYSGVVLIKMFDATFPTRPVVFLMARYYDEIELTINNGNFVKNEVGSEFDCVGNSGRSAMFPFTNVATLDIPWTTLLRSIYGDAPGIQVYRLVSTGPDVYEAVTVAITLTGGSYYGDPLENIHIDFGGPDTGYVVILA